MQKGKNVDRQVNFVHVLKHKGKGDKNREKKIVAV